MRRTVLIGWKKIKNRWNKLRLKKKLLYITNIAVPKTEGYEWNNAVTKGYA